MNTNMAQPSTWKKRQGMTYLVSEASLDGEMSPPPRPRREASPVPPPPPPLPFPPLPLPLPLPLCGDTKALVDAWLPSPAALEIFLFRARTASLALCLICWDFCWARVRSWVTPPELACVWRGIYLLCLWFASNRGSSNTCTDNANIQFDEDLSNTAMFFAYCIVKLYVPHHRQKGIESAHIQDKSA